MDYGNVNWIAVLIFGVVSMPLGFLWYGPLFSKPFLRLMKVKPEDLQPNPIIYVVSFIAALLTSYVLALIINNTGIDAWWEGAIAGAVVVIGIIAASNLHTVLYENRPLGLFLIFALYEIVLFTVAGLVFAVWK